MASSEPSREFTYIYRRPLWLALFRTLDAIGSLFSKPKLGIPDLSEAHRIQVLKFDQIGDLLLTQPLLIALRVTAPRAKIELVVGKERGDVARAILDTGEIQEWPVRIPPHSAPRFSANGVLRQILSARKRGPDVVVAAKEDPFTVLAAWLLGAPVRIGFREGGLGFLLTHTIPIAYQEPQFRVLARLAGPVGETVPAPTFPITQADDRAASSVLSLIRPPSNLPLLIVHAGAGAPTKRWSWGNFVATLAAVTRQRTVACLIVRGPDEAIPQVPENRLHPGSWVHVLSDTLDLGTLAALLARADLFFGNDSAPAHLARAVGIPAVVVFLTDAEPKRWGPAGSESTVLLPAELTPEAAASALIGHLDHRAGRTQARRANANATSNPNPSER